MITRLTLLIFLFSSQIFSMQKAIVVFGPSCSGKSMLSRKMCRWLGSQWHLVDRDVLIEDNQLNSKDLLAFAAYLNQLKEKSIVIDTNAYSQEFYDAIKVQQKIRVLVYTPLDQLLMRDAIRTNKFNRSEQKAEQAKKFVISTHDYFFNNTQGFPIPFLENEKQIYTPYKYDMCVCGTEEDIEKIITQLKGLLK